MTTLEDRRRCPKCQEPGRETGNRVRPQDRSIITTMTCENTRCRWNNETWIYQTRRDGSLVEPEVNRRKQFPALPGDGKAYLANLDAEINGSIGG